MSTKQLNRREFLRTSSLLGGAALLAACAPQPAPTEGASPVPSQPIKPPSVEILTMETNIVASNDVNNPPVNNSIQTINLKFNEPVDVKTIANNVKLYKMDGNGNAKDEPSIIKIDPTNPKLILINNTRVAKFTEGEEYKLFVSQNLKSTTGLALEKEFTGYFATNIPFALAGDNGTHIRSQIVIISDLHLGVDDRFAESAHNKPALVDFLIQVNNSPNLKELVIAGDLFDGWFLPMDFVLPKTQSAFFDMVAANNQTVVDAINAIIKGGLIKVTYTPGNHDLLMTQADVQRIFPGINQARDNIQGLGAYTTGSNSEITIEHGHRTNIFCAPDPISNRDITNNTTSVLPPGYFFTRIATSSVIEGQPQSGNTFPDVTANPNDASQNSLFAYSQVWKSLMQRLPVKEKPTDQVIKTNIDGYTQDYAINDFFPQQNTSTGKIELKLFNGIQDTWDQRQTINGVKIKVPVEIAILKAIDNGFTDSQAKTQFFDVDSSQRIVIFGHTHVAQLIPFTNLKNMKTIYANSGTWIDNAQGYPTMTFVVITPAIPGSAPQLVNLYQFSTDKSVTQWSDAQAITS
jgi:UDP-2,3-diacylglucosamine pyrophosphatase LpxH